MTGSARSGARSRIKSSTSSAVDDNDVAFRNPDKRNLKLRRDRNRADQSSLRILNVNLKIVLGIGFLAFLFTSYFIYNLVNLAEEPTKPRVITPFPAPKLMDLPQFQGKHKESLYWGTYRPHVYFGVRARAHRSLLAGLMWIGVRNGQYFMRHVCQDSDELSSYGWRRHNGRDFGHQVLVDQGLTLGTTFLKSKGDGSGYGGDWATRLDVSIEKTKDEGELLKSAHLFFYLADEDGNSLSLNENVVDTRETSLLASGSRRDVGDWELHLKSMFYELRENGLRGPWAHEGNMCYVSHGGPWSLGVPLVPLTSLRAVSRVSVSIPYKYVDDLEVHYSGFKTSNFHNLSDLVQQQLGGHARKFGRLQLPDMSDNSPNTLVFQISARIPFKIDFAFVSGTHFPNSRVEERVSNLTGSLLTSHLKEKEREFDNKFMKSFDLANKLDLESVNVGKAAIANLLGGIGYFYGQSKIALQRSSNIGSHDNFIQYWPAELFTAVPSRPFFPRGFLWDEGFHQLLIWRWDVHLCLDIVGHWLDLMNVDGWIPREQILGAEALSKVPEEFVAQHPTNGNPPTLFLVLRDIIHALKRESFTATESREIFSFLERSFVRLEAWFQWFNTTQSGKKHSSYYWHGRDRTTIRELNPKTLSSGLDDYPRSTHPTDDERHIDLRCWMFLAADCLHSITELFEDKKENGKVYHSTAKLLSDFDLLNQMHFDDAYGAYMDFGNHTDKVRLSWREVVVEQNYINRELIRQVLEKPELKLVPHVGYVSLFPFIVKIIPPDSWILGKQLDIISNRSNLWTDFGLRSLSKTSSLYMKRNTEHDPPYWRGPIWMNINYLVLSALHHYSREHGPYMDRARNIHDELRNNLIRNIVRNYQQTGFFWEQFDQKNGKGKGARVFTGWTSLVLLTMAEAYS